MIDQATAEFAAWVSTRLTGTARSDRPAQGEPVLARTFRILSASAQLEPALLRPAVVAIDSGMSRAVSSRA